MENKIDNEGWLGKLIIQEGFRSAPGIVPESITWVDAKILINGDWYYMEATK